ncbi:hypothetical protein D5F01_LYC24816 [Larimichthys crocea]|uniref:Bcl-2 Bcl-2 homology region 1-3 domain-containing protein n=1 Tax=Larimichthys crocea TaxID=215358 RepID=A0A6G0HE90_LARCR|nr:hypothetical protein D5F01_LYC24816 [Larimichthys crocea]
MQGPDIFVLSLNRAGGALSQRSEFDVLDDPNVMIHLDGTYDTYQCIFGELPVDDKGDKVTSMSVLAHSIFADGATNWGRIVSLVAFGVIVCQNSNKEEEEERLALVESVGEEISTYLLTDQRDWLLKNNSWVGFVEFFAEPQHVLKDALLCIAGFTGIGALIYFV